MKKALSILLALIMVLAISGCGITQDEAYQLVKDFSRAVRTGASEYDYQHPASLDKNSRERFGRLLQKPELLSEAVIKWMSDPLCDFYSCCKLLMALEANQFKNEAVKEQFKTVLKNEQAQVFSGSGADLANYIVTATWIQSSTYYTSIFEFFPYSEFTDAVKTNCAQVICQDGIGGYYDKHKDEHKDEHYWYSPLFKDRKTKGEVGYQEITVQHLFVGDLMIEVSSKVFYMTKPSEDINELNAALYYNGKKFSSNYELITAFLKKAKTENTYAASHMFLILNTGAVTVFNGSELFDIQYS